MASESQYIYNQHGEEFEVSEQWIVCCECGFGWNVAHRASLDADESCPLCDLKRLRKVLKAIANGGRWIPEAPRG